MLPSRHACKKMVNMTQSTSFWDSLCCLHVVIEENVGLVINAEDVED